MKRLLFVLLIGLLVFTQGIQPLLHGAAASVKENNITIYVDDHASNEKAIVKVEVANDDQKSIQLILPTDTSYDEKLMNDVKQENVIIHYDRSKHMLQLTWENEPNKLEATIILSNIKNEVNEVISKSIYEDGESEEKKHLFNVTIENDEVAQPESVHEEVTEEASSTAHNEVETDQADDEEANATEQKTDEIQNEKIGEAEEAKRKEKAEEVESNEKSTMQVTPFSGNLNVDIDISPQRNTVLAGNSAAYHLVLKITGSRTEYTNAQITVDLPITDYTNFTQDVSELIIDGVTPTYNESTHQLIYAFDSIKAGRSYETTVKVNTENGVSPEGTELIGKAMFEADEQPAISDEAIVHINASNTITSSKQFLEVSNNDRNLPYPNSNTVWEMKVSVPKKDTGQMYIKEGSQIVITDTLPAGLTYVSTEKGPEPTQSGNQLTWTFDAPTIDDQKNAEDELFSTTLQVWLKVEPGTVDTTQENNIEVEGTFINDEISTSTAKDQIFIVDSETANGDIVGSWYIPNHLGPDDSGGVGNNDNRNPNPIVYDDEILQFRHGIAPLLESKHGDFQLYTTSYEIDPNLIFKELRTPGGFIYRPNSNYPNGIPLQTDPLFNIKAIVNGSERMLVEDANTNELYTRSDFGLEETDVVSVIYYDFTYAPAGMLNVGTPQYYFEVIPGYVGEVKNVFDVYGVNGAGQAFSNEYNSDPLAGPRTAQIAPRPETQPPIAMVQVELLDHESGEVIHGENRLKVALTNAQSSTIHMQKQLETVVLLPAGVTVNDNPNATYIDGDGRSSQNTSSALDGNYQVLSDDYNGSGRQLIKINWNDSRLRIGKNVAAELDVTISQSTPNTLQFDVYGFSGDEELRVPETSGGSITDTVLQTDEGDINGDGITDQPRLKSGNLYTIRGKYDIQTEKLVKGELDDEYTYFGHTIPSGSIDYQVKLTNTTGVDITEMTLMDVLPSVGDLGITDNVDRGSLFTPKMTNSIVLPAEWQDKVNVFYSTAKNPQRDDLTRNTAYPDTTTQLTNPAGAEEPNWIMETDVTDWSTIHSFKIELKEGIEWVKGQDMMIQFTMQAPSELEVDREVLDPSVEPTERAAWNSFAVATDHGQPVEPLRVGVYMDYEVEDPAVEKTVNDSKETTELIDREERFTWKVEYDFGNYTGNWESVVFRDEIHELLDIEAVQVLDQNGQDVSANGELDITNNVVTFTLNKQDESFAYLTGQTYTLVIESKMKGSATDEELEPFIQTGGIPNEAELIINDNPTPSNEVKVKPPVLGDIQIVKMDAATNEVLAGAEFELMKCPEGNSRLTDCTLVTTGISDENGTLTFEKLQLGSYQLIESKAPEGYRIVRKPIAIELKDQHNRQVEIEVENSKNNWELPKTGGIGTLVFYLFGAILMTGAFIFLVRKNKQSN